MGASEPAKQSQTEVLLGPEPQTDQRQPLSVGDGVHQILLLDALQHRGVAHFGLFVEPVDGVLLLVSIQLLLDLAFGFGEDHVLAELPQCGLLVCRGVRREALPELGLPLEGELGGLAALRTGVHARELPGTAVGGRHDVLHCEWGGGSGTPKASGTVFTSEKSEKSRGSVDDAQRHDGGATQH